MKLGKIFKVIAVNFLSALIGAIIGIIAFVYYGLHFWLPQRIANLSPGFGVLFGGLALIAVTVILFSVLGIILGGILGIIFYQILMRLKKR
jgi:hypothetical protein